MPRRTKFPKLVLALSPRAAADALGLSYRHIADAIADGSIVVRRGPGLARRILIGDSDTPGTLLHFATRWPITTNHH